MEIFILNYSLRRLILKHPSPFNNNINPNHLYWLISPWLPHVQDNKLQTLCKVIAQGNFIFCKRGRISFHEALDWLTFEKKNSVRIMPGGATDTHDLNVLEKMMPLLRVCVLFEILVIFMSAMVCKMSYCSVDRIVLEKNTAY